jgi:hypothetical protein
MRVPIVCVDTRLRQFAFAFVDCFSRPQFRHFMSVLVALLLCHQHAYAHRLAANRPRWWQSDQSQSVSVRGALGANGAGCDVAPAL